MDGKTERYGIVLNKTKNVCVWVHITQMKTDDTGAKQIKQTHKNEPTNNNIYIYIYIYTYVYIRKQVTQKLIVQGKCEQY